MPGVDDRLPEKFTNTHLTRGHNAQTPHGTYDVIVQLVRPEYRPSYMRILGQFSPGFMRARLDLADFPQASADHNVIAVELRSHQSLATETIQ
ncbi:MAG: hypothetical protein WBK91_06925 [Alphaproteobacteria bacterium]